MFGKIDLRKIIFTRQGYVLLVMILLLIISGLRLSLNAKETNSVPEWNGGPSPLAETPAEEEGEPIYQSPSEIKDLDKWKIYQSTQYQVEFSYPPTWNAYSIEAKFIPGLLRQIGALYPEPNVGGFSIMIWDKKLEDVVSNFIDIQIGGSSFLISRKNVKLDSFYGEEVVYKTHAGAVETQYFFKKNNLVYQVYGGTKDSTGVAKTMNQIFNTFFFLQASNDPLPEGYSIPCYQCNYTKDAYATDYPTDTSNWLSYTIPEENLSFKYPPDWKVDRTQNAVDSFVYRIKSPNNFILLIGDYSGLGGGCGFICRDFNIWNIVLERLSFYTQPLYIVVNGIRKDDGHGSMITRFNVLLTDHCYENICYGFDGKKGVTIISGGFKDPNSQGERFTYMDPDTFIKTTDVKTAVGILKTLHY